MTYNFSPYTETYIPAHYGAPVYNNTNQNTQPQPRNNAFNWDIVKKYDPKLLQATQDVESMNELANEFLNSIFSDADMNIIGNPLVYRLIQELQVVLEYMFKTQKISETSYNDLLQENDRLHDVNEKYHRRIHKLFDACKLLRGIERCPTCHRIFPSFKTLDEHVMRKHPDMIELWKSLRAGQTYAPTNTKHNDFLENELKKIQKMLTEQSQTITKSATEMRQTMNEKTQTPKPQINPFVKTQNQKTSPITDDVETIKALEEQTPKAKTAPLKLSEYPEPPPQPVMVDTVTLDEVQKIKNQPAESSSSKNVTNTRIPNGLRQTAKEFISRPRTVDREDTVFKNLREQIRADVREQGVVTKIMAKSNDKDEVKELLKMSMKAIHPMTRRNGTNNIADLRRPPKRYTPEIHELMLEISSDAATYTSTTFIEDLPSEPSKKEESEHSASTTSKSKSKTKDKSEKSKDKESEKPSKEPVKTDEKSKQSDKPKQDNKTETTEYEYEYEYEDEYESDEPKIITKKADQGKSEKSEVSNKPKSESSKPDKGKVEDKNKGKTDDKNKGKVDDKNKGKQEKPQAKAPPKQEEPEYDYIYEYEEEEYEPPPPPKKSDTKKQKAKSNSSASSAFEEKKGKANDDSPEFFYEDTTKPKNGKKPAQKQESSSKTESDDFLALLEDGKGKKNDAQSKKSETKSQKNNSKMSEDAIIDAILAD